MNYVIFVLNKRVAFSITYSYATRFFLKQKSEKPLKVSRFLRCVRDSNP